MITTFALATAMSVCQDDGWRESEQKCRSNERERGQRNPMQCDVNMSVQQLNRKIIGGDQRNPMQCDVNRFSQQFKTETIH